MAILTLNEQARRVADDLAGQAAALRVAEHTIGGARVLDFGVTAGVAGGLRAGLGLARACLSGLAEVALEPADVGGTPVGQIAVATDHPVLACMASQYAGWQISVGKYFAMGSGPMRAAYGKEALFDAIPGREKPPVAVGVLETGKLPGEPVVAFLSEKLGLPADRLTLLCAPASSLAGTIQVVARSLETALHKMYELHFDLKQVISGFGTAPLPPIAANELEAIGRTNDAILYGGKVVIWLRGDDEQIAALGPRVPASASSDYGQPFRDIFQHHGGDFYKIDPLLFSPGQVTIHNLNTGRCHIFGHIDQEILRRSFFDK